MPSAIGPSLVMALALAGAPVRAAPAGEPVVRVEAVPVMTCEVRVSRAGRSAGLSLQCTRGARVSASAGGMVRPEGVAGVATSEVHVAGAGPDSPRSLVATVIY